MTAPVSLALIGDMVDSRQLDGGRSFRVQEDWTTLFAAWAPADGVGLAARPTITLGDEFRGLFTAYARHGSRAAEAAEMGETRGAVSQRQQAAGWGLYRTGWESLGHDLARRLDEKGGA